MGAEGQTPPSEGISEAVQEEENDQSEELEEPEDSQSSSGAPVTSSAAENLMKGGSRTEDNLKETSSMQAAEDEVC